MKYESHIWASVGTILWMALVLLLLLFVFIDVPIPPEEEGIEVAFGNEEDGYGFTPTPVSPQEVLPQPEPVAVTPPKAEAPSKNDFMTQEDEATLALEKQRKEEAKKKALEEQRIRQQQEALAKAEAARIAAEQKAAAEKAAAEQAARDKAANAMSGLFGNSAGSGQGTTSGSGQTGNPVGKGSGMSNGNGWSLTGRDLKGKLATPSYNVDAEGIVVVEIRVDASGKVISATQGRGTNTGNQALINAAINAAKTATFTPGDGVVTGTITYTFKLTGSSN